MKYLPWIFAAAALAVTPNAWALGDAAAGEQLVTSECSTCHAAILRPSQKGAPPTFREVIEGRKLSRNDFRTFVRQSHYPMPPKALSGTQIEDLVAYFDKMGYWP